WGQTRSTQKTQINTQQRALKPTAWVALCVRRREVGCVTRTFSEIEPQQRVRLIDGLDRPLSSERLLAGPGVEIEDATNAGHGWDARARTGEALDRAEVDGTLDH